MFSSWSLFIIFHYLLEKMARIFTENVGTMYEIFFDMDDMLIHFRHFQNRDVWKWGKLGLHPRFEPVLRNTLFVLGLTLCVIIEYFIERVMQFYGYEKFLAKINRPVVVAYRKWQFKKMMSQRLDHQKKRLVKRHQNANGNFTWNCLLKDYSLRTAISPDSTMMTAIEFTDEEYEVAKKVQATNNAKKNQFNKSCKF